MLVANGHQLPCASMCEGFEWKAQGQVFKVDAYVLSLENYDLILGTQWLAILRDILWSFEVLKMIFTQRDQQRVLQGQNGEGLLVINHAKLLKV